MMLDDSGEEISVFDFGELSDHLLEQGSQVSPAEIHGCLSGLHAAGAAGPAEAGLDAVMEVLDTSANGHLAQRIMQLHTATGAALRDDDFGFHLLLPDDDSEIQERTRALGNWCSGFLNGLAYGSARSDKGTEWSSDAREILEDIAAMSQADVGDDESEEETESSYMEVVEYLRFAVLNLCLESEAKEDFVELTRDPQEPLH